MNFEQVLNFVLVFLLLTLNIQLPARLGLKTVLLANIYLLKVNKRNARKRFEICCCDFVLLFLLLTLNVFHTFFKYFYC